MRVCFFFSSRRRHTRCGRDWSSDVCSSDLESAEDGGAGGEQFALAGAVAGGEQVGVPESAPASLADPLDEPESPEPEPLAPPDEPLPDAEEPVDPEEALPELVACGVPLADIPLVPPAPASLPPAPPPEGPEQAPTLPAAVRTSHENTREMGFDDAAFMSIPRGGSGGSTARPSWFHTRCGFALPTDRHAEPGCKSGDGSSSGAQLHQQTSSARPDDHSQRKPHRRAPP